MGGLIMLQQELESLREKALKTIFDYIRDNSKNDYTIITYKNNPNCYLVINWRNIPTLTWYEKGLQYQVVGDTINDIVEIADAIEEYKKDNIDWVIYPQVSITLKATSMQGAKEKAVKYLTDKGIPKELVIISDKVCYKV